MAESQFYRHLGKVWIDGGTVAITGEVPIEFPLTTLTDISGTITLGGTAQNIAAANADRVGFSIQNNSTGDLWFNTLAAAVIASPSYRIPPGALYESPINQRPVGAISLIGATTAQAFAAREW